MELEATFENGVLRPSQSLDLRENEIVMVTVRRKSEKLSDIFGIMPWTGDPEVLRKLAEDDELGIMESP